MQHPDSLLTAKDALLRGLSKVSTLHSLSTLLLLGV